MLGELLQLAGPLRIEGSCLQFILMDIRFLGVTANEEYGGLGMGYQAHCVVMEEISRASGMRTGL